MKNWLSPAEMIKKTAAWEENDISKRTSHNVSPTFKKWLVNALDTRTSGSLNAFFFYSGPTQQERPGPYFNPQQQSIIFTHFYVALYSVAENTFFLKIHFSSIEYVFPFSQDFVFNLLYLLVYFVSQITAIFNLLHPQQHFSFKTRATRVSRKRYHSNLFCSQLPLLLGHTVVFFV